MKRNVLALGLTGHVLVLTFNSPRPSLPLSLCTGASDRGTLAHGNCTFFGDRQTPSRQEKNMGTIQTSLVRRTDTFLFITSTPNTFPGGVQGGTPSKKNTTMSYVTLGVAGRTSVFTDAICTSAIKRIRYLEIDLSPDADGRGMSRRLQDEWKKM